MHSNTRKRYSYILAIPGLFLYILFFILPAVGGLALSFVKILGFNLSSARFGGLQNYADVFIQPNMRRAIVNSFIFALITTMFKMGIGLSLAVPLNRKMALTNALRTIFFLPAVINTVAVGLIFSSLMHPSNGLVNSLLQAMGLGILAKSWLVDTHLAIFSVCAIEIWKWSGFTMVILLSGMQTIGREYYEAAEIDGAGGFTKFKYITFPLLLPAFNNALILSIIGGLKVFDLIQATTQGGPGSATEVFGTLIYKSFGAGRLGEGCAASIILAVVIAAIAIPAYQYIANREVEM
ncbi:carbohydrate ABC transporter permease [Lacrimispora aerotolerans]|uniref:carbohydrate ABC transporter permease n=1 Tax=Lacrimispora aerotolerans TaxID=36832 RepID=UPI00047BEB51|nr:sugar ABC transporter permease [Lacrimispora aerotolerans]